MFELQRRRKTPMRIALTLLAALALLYLAACALVFLRQRSMIYFPQPAATSEA